MGKAFRDIQQLPRIRRQLDTKPLAAGGRTGSQIDADVEHSAAKTSDHLHFGVRRILKMQSTQRAGPGTEPRVDLGNSRVKVMTAKLIGAPHPREEAAFVDPPLEL